MKKFIQLAAMLVFVTLVAKAQKTTVFKFKYLPKHDYQFAIKMDIDMQMTMNGDSAETEKLKAQGIKQPILMKMNMTAATEINTGVPKVDKGFPFNMSYKDFTTKISMNGAEMPISKNPVIGQNIYGECDAAGNLHVDSMSIKSANAQVKAAMTDLMNKLQKQIIFPDKPLAIGESFTQDIPMNLPMTGANMDVSVKTTYTLTAIKEDKGYFDMVMAMNMDLNMDKGGVAVAVKGNGSGTGKVIFDIAKSYPLSMVSDLDMKVNMDIKSMKMAMNMKMRSDMENTITVAQQVKK